MYIYVIFGFTVAVGVLTTLIIFALLARRPTLSPLVRSALATAFGLLVVGLFSFGIGYALYHRLYVPSSGMDETQAAVILFFCMVLGSASTLLSGASAGLWEMLRKK